MSAQGFGTTGDTLTPCYYDGDGRTDLSIWRPSTGQFWALRSTSGLAVYNWGTNGDLPVANFNVH